MEKMIAIDGPAGSGKSTLGKGLADCLGYIYFDTGAMYRAVTHMALLQGIAIESEGEVTHLAETILIDIQPASVDDGRSCDVLVDGMDVTWEIRRPEVDGQVSVVSAYGGVRKALTAAQRRIGLRGGIVMVGRDIGTVVLPEADIKVYLDASLEERTKRRYSELAARGVPADREKIRVGLMARDEIDSHRAVAPLRPAEDAVIVNSDHMNIEQVLDHVKHLVEC